MGLSDRDGAIKGKEGTGPFPLKAHHCGISVPDLEKGIAWYGDMLGFVLKRRLVAEGLGAKIAFLSRGDFQISSSR